MPVSDTEFAALVSRVDTLETALANTRSKYQQQRERFKTTRRRLKELVELLTLLSKNGILPVWCQRVLAKQLDNSIRDEAEDTDDDGPA